MTPLRVLHLPHDISSEPLLLEGPLRSALAHERQNGRVGETLTLPFLMEFARGRDWNRVLTAILAAAESFRPDLIFWQNVDACPVTPAYLRRLKALSSKPLLVYHDGDPYGRWQCRMPGPVRIMMAEADLVCLVGLGEFAALARQFGAREILYTPSWFDAARFGADWTPTRERPVLISMVGNLWKSRVPFLYIPGGRLRKRLAELLCVRYGRQFALYGQGWGSLPSARGFVPLYRLTETIRESWVNVSWNHFSDCPCYFSDRLAIGLAAGVPQVSSWQPGYDPFFAGCQGLFLAKTPEAACRHVETLLAKPREELIDLGRQGREWALHHLEASVVFRPILAKCLELLRQTRPL
jgi:hypothetical protein